MGLFSRKVNVNVMGRQSYFDAADKRYSKQRKSDRKKKAERISRMKLESHTAEEVMLYIQDKYGVSPIPYTDDRFRRAYMGVKAHLVFRDLPDAVKTPEMEEPDHPPVSDLDPDYILYRKNLDERWKEATQLPSDVFPMKLCVYNIPIERNGLVLSWLEIYVEAVHSYLAFKTIVLEYEDEYTIKRITADIVNYFGADEKDREENNERYRQLCGVQ